LASILGDTEPSRRACEDERGGRQCERNQAAEQDGLAPIRSLSVPEDGLEYYFGAVVDAEQQPQLP
jgi:hypothetical protein